MKYGEAAAREFFNNHGGRGWRRVSLDITEDKLSQLLQVAWQAGKIDGENCKTVNYGGKRLTHAVIDEVQGYLLPMSESNRRALQAMMQRDADTSWFDRREPLPPSTARDPLFRVVESLSAAIVDDGLPARTNQSVFDLDAHARSHGILDRDW